jgi:hypothetical protein
MDFTNTVTHSPARYPKPSAQTLVKSCVCHFPLCLPFVGRWFGVPYLRSLAQLKIDLEAGIFETVNSEATRRLPHHDSSLPPSRPRLTFISRAEADRFYLQTSSIWLPRSCPALYLFTFPNLQNPR